MLTVDANHKLADALYRAPFVVLSHGTEPDPLFNDANLTAQRLSEMTWAQITAMPSRLSAEPLSCEESDRDQGDQAGGTGDPTFWHECAIR